MWPERQQWEQESQTGHCVRGSSTESSFFCVCAVCALMSAEKGEKKEKKEGGWTESLWRSEC